MFSKRKIFVLAFFCLTCLGCDQMNALYEKVSARLRGTPASSPTVAPGEPVASPSVEAQGPLKPNELVRVGNWSMMEDEFKARLEAIQEVVPEYDPSDAEQNRMILQELVNQQLFVQEAERGGLGQDPDVQMAVEEFRRQLMMRQLAVRLTENITVSDAEAEEFYNENRGEFVGEGQWRVREIVVGSEAEANQIRIDLYQGADFTQIAREKSRALSRDQGGDLGLLSFFPFPRMRDVVAALEEGEVSSVFGGPEGYYIVKLEEQIGGEISSFAEVAEDIKAGLTILKQQERIINFLEDARSRTNILINEKLLTE